MRFSLSILLFVVLSVNVHSQTLLHCWPLKTDSHDGIGTFDGTDISISYVLNSAYINGTGSKITTSDVGFPNGSNNVTMQTWVKIPSPVQPGCNIISYGTASSSAWRIMYVDNSLTVKFSQYGNGVSTPTNVWVADAWYLFTAINNGNVWTLYVNSVNRVSSSMTTTTTLSGTFYIGSDIINEFSRAYYSYVKIYSGILPQSGMNNEILTRKGYIQ